MRNARHKITNDPQKKYRLGTGLNRFHEIKYLNTSLLSTVCKLHLSVPPTFGKLRTFGRRTLALEATPPHPLQKKKSIYIGDTLIFCVMIFSFPQCQYTKQPLIKGHGRKVPIDKQNAKTTKACLVFLSLVHWNDIS